MKSTTKIIILALCFTAMSGVTWGQTIGDFRTHQNGNWNSPSTWERFDSAFTWVYPAPHTPTSADGEISIRYGDTVTITANVTADQLVVSGRLEVESGAVLTIADGIGTDLQVWGDTLRVNGGLINNGTMQINGTLQIAGTLTNNATTQIDGTFQLDQGGSANGNDLIYGINGALVFNNSSGPYAVNSGDIIWPSTNGPAQVAVQGAGGITMNVARAVSSYFRTAARVTHANNLTFSGGVEINAGGFFDSSPIYSGDATLVYNTGDSYDVSAEWGSGTSVGPGVPMNVNIMYGTTVNMPSSPRTCPGDLLIYEATLVLNITVGADLSVGGNWFNVGTFIPNSRAVIFNGVTEQDIGGVTTFDYLTVNNAAGIVLQGGEGDATSVKVNQTLVFTAGNIRLVGYIYGSFLILSGSVSGATITRHVVTYDECFVIRSIAGGDSFQFPVGPTETSYNPLTIALAPDDTTETFSVRVDSTIEPGALSDSLFVQRTWDIQEATPGDNHAALTFQWAGAEEGAKFTRNASSTYLNNVEVVRNGVASGTDPYIVSTTGGFPCTEFSLYTVGRSGGLGTVKEHENGIPASFMLSQNYPNPFNPSTTIRYAIPQAGYVMLKVYNILGREIETLVSEKQPAGEHAIRWNSVGLRSGVYFYRLQVGELVTTRKLILL